VSNINDIKKPKLKVGQTILGMVCRGYRFHEQAIKTEKDLECFKVIYVGRKYFKVGRGEYNISDWSDANSKHNPEYMLYASIEEYRTIKEHARLRMLIEKWVNRNELRNCDIATLQKIATVLAVEPITAAPCDYPIISMQAPVKLGRYKKGTGDEAGLILSKGGWPFELDTRAGMIELVNLINRHCTPQASGDAPAPAPRPTKKPKPNKT